MSCYPIRYTLPMVHVLPSPWLLLNSYTILLFSTRLLSYDPPIPITLPSHLRLPYLPLLPLPYLCLPLSLPPPALLLRRPLPPLSTSPSSPSSPSHPLSPPLSPSLLRLSTSPPLTLFPPPPPSPPPLHLSLSSPVSLSPSFPLSPSHFHNSSLLLVHFHSHCHH